MVAIAARLEASGNLTQRIAFEARRSATGVDKVDPRRWTLQGYIFVRDESWLRDKTVALFDANTTMLSGTQVELDGNKFLIRYAAPPADATGRIAQEVSVGVVAIGDRRTTPVFLDPRSLRPQNGRLTYVEITIGTTPYTAPPTRPSSTNDPTRPPQPEAAEPTIQPAPPRRTSTRRKRPST